MVIATKSSKSGTQAASGQAQRRATGKRALEIKEEAGQAHVSSANELF